MSQMSKLMTRASCVDVSISLKLQRFDCVTATKITITVVSNLFDHFHAEKMYLLNFIYFEHEIIIFKYPKC